MPKIILLTLLFSIFLVSCEKQSFKVKDYEVSEFTGKEFVNSILPKVYLEARYNYEFFDSDKIEKIIQQKKKFDIEKFDIEKFDFTGYYNFKKDLDKLKQQSLII